MTIANIVSNDSINIGPEFNVVKSSSDISDNNLPILYVGYELSQHNLPHIELNVLNKKVDNKTFWTFRRNEKRDVYSIDLENFIRFSYKNYMLNISYIDVDFIQYSNSKMDKVKKKLWSLNNVISYKSNNNVIYVYADNLIFGLDLNIAQYIGHSVQKIEEKIIKKSSTFLQGKEILIEYNNHLERLNYDVKYIPVLYSINPNE
jgi:hypothetical protein